MGADRREPRTPTRAARVNLQLLIDEAEHCGRWLRGQSAAPAPSNAAASESGLAAVPPRAVPIPSRLCGSHHFDCSLLHLSPQAPGMRSGRGTERYEPQTTLSFDLMVGMDDVLAQLVKTFLKPLLEKLWDTYEVVTPIADPRAFAAHTPHPSPHRSAVAMPAV